MLVQEIDDLIIIRRVKMKRVSFRIFFNSKNHCLLRKETSVTLETGNEVVEISFVLQNDKSVVNAFSSKSFSSHLEEKLSNDSLESGEREEGGGARRNKRKCSL